MARNQSRDCHSDPIAGLLFVPSHFHSWEERGEIIESLSMMNVAALIYGASWTCCRAKRADHPMRALILETYLLVSSTTVASINSVDLSLTITWQSSASGDLISFFFVYVSGVHGDGDERRREMKNDKLWTDFRPFYLVWRDEEKRELRAPALVLQLSEFNKRRNWNLLLADAVWWMSRGLPKKSNLFRGQVTLELDWRLIDWNEKLNEIFCFKRTESSLEHLKNDCLNCSKIQ